MKTQSSPMKSKTRLAPKSTSQISIRDHPGKQAREALQIRNVLVPVDFSAPSLSAVQFALPLIAKFGASPHLVHVFPADSLFTGLVGMPFVLPEVDISRSVHRRLTDVAKQYSIELARENIHALRGKPFDEICRLARDLNIDLIIIATRGNTGLKHLVLGSTAEHVVRYSPCPVLVVRDSERSGAVTGFRKILVPTDFSECSMKGLVYAKALAKQFESKLVLLNSVHLQYYVASDEYGRYDMPQLLQYAETSAREQMHDLVEKTDWDGLEVDRCLQSGHPGQQICDCAKDGGVDFIVTSTHGATGFKHLLLGSVAEYVVRHAHCPVLVVPARSSELQIHPTNKQE
jgi:nucleotide-binding universal stress UspA family protein